MSQLELRTQLIQVLTMQVTQINCQSILPKLDDYVDAQLSGAPYATRFPEVALHLDACVPCAEAYDLLYVSALAEARGVLPHITSLPDLSFLQPRSTSTLLEQIRTAVQRIGERISLQLAPAFAPALRPTFAGAALRGASDTQRYQEKLIELTPDPSWQTEWPVMLVAYRDNLQPTNCLLEVTVKPNGWEWPDLEGIRVTVSVDKDQRIGLTDAWGMTTFESIPTTWLTEMKLEVIL